MHGRDAHATLACSARLSQLSYSPSQSKEFAMPGLLDGKKGLVLNIANDRSIAWHIANNAIKHGATCGFGFLPMEKMERRVHKSLEEMGVNDPWLAPCDVGSDESIES